LPDRDLGATIIEFDEPRTVRGSQIIDERTVAGDCEPDLIARIQAQDTLVIKQFCYDGDQIHGARCFFQRPFDMDEMLDAFALRFQSALIFRVGTALPARPDRGRVHIWDVACKIASPKGGGARRIELMSKLIELLLEIPDGRLIQIRIFSGPIVFIAEPQRIIDGWL